MHFLISITGYKDVVNHCAVPPRRALLSLDDRMVQIAGRDSLFDLVVEILAGVTFPDNFEDVLRPFTHVSERGLSTAHAVIPPGALRLTLLHPHFPDMADHRIDITMEDKTDSFSRSSSVSLDGGPALALGFGDLVCAPDREHGPNTQPAPLFEGRHGRNPNGDLRPDQVFGGSLITGLFEALLCERGQVARTALTRDHAILAGLLAFHAGFAVRISDTHRPSANNATSAARSAHDLFLSEGYVISERGWNPELFLPGPRLDEAIAGSEDTARRFGMGLALTLSQIDAVSAHRVTRALIEKMGEDIVQFSLPDHPRHAASTHAQLKIQAELDGLLCCARTLPTPSHEERS